MLITINTDASYSREKGTAGWACWIVYEGIRIRKAGRFKTMPTSSADAEAKAVLNALSILCALSLKANYNPSKIIINCDLLGVERQISRDPELCRCRLKYVSAMGHPKIEHRHVKGHSGTGTPRQYVNDWCDKMSRKASGAKAKKKSKS